VDVDLKIDEGNRASQIGLTLFLFGSPWLAVVREGVEA